MQKRRNFTISALPGVYAEAPGKFQRGRGAGDGIRTRDINLGKVALYQLSYSRVGPKLHCPSFPKGCQIRRGWPLLPIRGLDFNSWFHGSLPPARARHGRRSNTFGTDTVLCNALETMEIKVQKFVVPTPRKYARLAYLQARKRADLAARLRGWPSVPIRIERLSCRFSTTCGKLVQKVRPVKEQ